MGGGKDQKQANSQLQSQAAYQTQQQKDFDARNQGDLANSRSRADDLYGSLKGGYESLLNPQVGTSGTPGSSGGGGGGGGFVPPSASDPRFKSVEDQYKKYMETGGWDPDTKGKQQGRIDALTEIGKTGGISPEDQARLRGSGIYEEFGKTGGYSDRDIANIRSRATSGIPALYNRIQDESGRLGSVQGGYGPGRAAMMSRLARQSAGDISSANLNAEVGIKDAVNKGRQWGAQGMTSSETSLQDLLTRNKLSGLTGANTGQQNMQESIMGGQQWGTGGLNQLAEADRQAAFRSQELGMQGAAMGAANDRWAQEFALRQKGMGLEGLAGLYTSSPAEYQADKQFQLGSADTYGGVINQGSVAQKTGNKSPWDAITGIAGAAAGGITGGFSNFGRPRPQAQA